MICQPGPLLKIQCSAGTAFKKKKSLGAASRRAQTLVASLGIRAGLPGAQTRVSPDSAPAAVGTACAISFCLSSPSSYSFPSLAATGFYPYCSLKPSSQCAARPNTRSCSRSQQLPLKLQCIITTSCYGCWPASSANKHPDTRSSREATACSWQQQILQRKCPHPWKTRERSPCLSCRSRRPAVSSLLRVQRGSFLLFIGR